MVPQIGMVRRGSILRIFVIVLLSFVFLSYCFLGALRERTVTSECNKLCIHVNYSKFRFNVGICVIIPTYTTYSINILLLYAVRIDDYVLLD